MLKRKYFLRSALCTALALSILVGCGGTSDTQSTETATEPNTEQNATEVEEQPAAEGTGSTEFWADKQADKVKADRLAETWTADSGVDISIVSYPDVASYQTAIQQSIDSPTAPGMFTWWSGPQLQTLVENDKLVDLTAEWPYYIEAGVSPDIQAAFTIDGKTYAAPYSVLYNVCLVNKTVTQNAGITTAPATFDEFLADLEKIKQSGVTPIGLKNDSWASFIWFQQLVAAYDPQLYLDICNGTKPYTDPAVVEVMYIWKDMIDKGYFAEPISPKDTPKALAKGDIAILLEPVSDAAAYETEYGMIPGETLGSFVVPSMNGDKSTIFFEASPIVIPKASKDKDSAIMALRGYYKTDTQNVMVQDSGIANTSNVQVTNSVIQDVVDLTADQENYQLMLRFYENTPEEIRDYAINELSKFMYGEIGVEEVLANIQTKADEVWAKLGQ